MFKFNVAFKKATNFPKKSTVKIKFLSMKFVVHSKRNNCNFFCIAQQSQFSDGLAFSVPSRLLQCAGCVCVCNTLKSHNETERSWGQLYVELFKCCLSQYMLVIASRKCERAFQCVDIIGEAGLSFENVQSTAARICIYIRQEVNSMYSFNSNEWLPCETTEDAQHQSENTHRGEIRLDFRVHREKQTSF